MTAFTPCPCQCGRQVNEAQYQYADEGVEIAWATRILDIATQYEASRHPLAPSGDRWMTRYLLAAHGNPDAAHQLPNPREVDSWFEAVQAITRTHRTAVIRSRFQPSTRPHTPNQRNATPPTPAGTETGKAKFSAVQDTKDDRWVNVGTKDPTVTVPAPHDDDPELEESEPAELPSFSEFLSNDLSVESAKQYWTMLPSEKRRTVAIAIAAVVVVFLVFFVL